MQETILITGSSGLVGTHLTALLLSNKYIVKHISRHIKEGDVPCFTWNLDEKVWDSKAIEGVDYIVHLAGANVAEGRWTKARKRKIFESRAVGSQLVAEMVEASKGRIKGVVSASAVGYYGTKATRNSKVETDKAGADFLANVCVTWEKEILKCKTNVTVLRTGVVLSKNGGAIPKMLSPIKWGVGSPLGSGDQIMPWVHINDLCEMYIFAIKNKFSGVYNAVAPEITSNSDFIHAIAKVVNQRIFFPNVPSFVLKMMLGEMSTMLLTGVAASSKKIITAEFKFQFKNLDNALNQLLHPVI